MLYKKTKKMEKKMEKKKTKKEEMKKEEKKKQKTADVDSHLFHRFVKKGVGFEGTLCTPVFHTPPPVSSAFRSDRPKARLPR